jgi:hypothetical protein
MNKSKEGNVQLGGKFIARMPDEYLAKLIYSSHGYISSQSGSG